MRKIAVSFLVLVSLVLSHVQLRAQVIELLGGTSTLYQSTGGTVSVRSGSYTASAGAGTVAGQFVGGAQLVKATEHAKYTLGTDNVPFDLPTDIFQSGHYLTAMGGGMNTKVGNAKLYAFAGATSTSFNSPFFVGARAATPTGILFVTGKVSPEWSASTRVIVSRRMTVLHSFAWDSGTGTQMAFTGGMGSNQLYGAASLSVERRWIDLKAAYYEAGSQFRRADVLTPLTSEPDRENILVTIRPAKSLSFGTGRQNYLTPVSGTEDNVKSSVNQASVNYEIIGVGLSATLFQSTYGDGGDLAMVCSANRNITSRVHAQVSYLESRPTSSASTNSFVTNVEEIISPRFTISQSINSSNGQNNLGFGGSFLSNFATFSADYQTYYVPARVESPFEQALILNAEIHLFGRLTLSGGTFVGSDGKLLYTTEAEGEASRQPSGSVGAFQHYSMGNLMIRGRVVDVAGQPVVGAALLVDQLEVYSDSNGYFFVRERKPHMHPLTVLVDQFLNGGTYRVVSAPAEAKSSANENQLSATVIVEKVFPGRS
jgi:hypothetical protein